MTAAAGSEKANAPPPEVGAAPAPPVPNRPPRRDFTGPGVFISLLMLTAGWALLSYLDVNCVGFDVRDLLPRRHVHRAPPPPTHPVLPGEVSEVAMGMHDAVAGFFREAGSFRCPQPQRFTREEVALHHTESDLWIVVDGNVLDVSAFVEQHPGGRELLNGAGGQDMAAVFARFHHPSTVSLFDSFCIGQIQEPA